MCFCLVRPQFGDIPICHIGCDVPALIHFNFWVEWGPIFISSNTTLICSAMNTCHEIVPHDPYETSSECMQIIHQML